MLPQPLGGRASFPPGAAASRCARPSTLRRPRPRDLYWRLTQRRKQKALRSGDWKYLTTAKDGEHLFDLSTDPGEKHDRKVERPEVLAELRRKYTEWEGRMLTPIPLEANG
jgi:arylsulfatase A-like enzyme